MSRYEVNNLIKNLSQSITSKNSIKKLKVWGIAAVIVILTITVGILEHKADENFKNNVLTLNDIVKVFKKQNIYLKEGKLKSTDDFDLKGIKPSIYKIADNKDTILIYIFKSFQEREEVLNETNRYSNSYSFEEVPYNAKNALIVFIPSEIPKTEEDFISIFKTRELISNTVFKFLNDGKERVYKGESENWEGTFTLRYYEHWIEDENGLHYDSYSAQYPKLKYKKTDIGSVGLIIFEYDTTHGKGNFNGLGLNKEGYADIGGGGGSMLEEKAEIKYTIKWKDKEEHIVLKAQ
ncbi:hypothetical protein CLHOM_22990 [Clostridium homopropionicum DSM 5847]|uniref:Uncharacterized protein n=1 Tax=Clostridium homopropionicum DSM 5847 TaxID=1121318 RepID=A0A0L6Z8U9_9CLOT|nr:hypothetical protein [Clostridium homopropionicum]KOA19193.1 hypothetical protein CLHOM_22990 [Clostridium homopropionicum DSM 5847]SFG17008.1 hypothetical protein SAMN04488501_10656 [Clostridium homopropionicum]